MALATVQITGNQRSRFLMEYEDTNGRATAIYCEGPDTVAGWVRLDNGIRLPQTGFYDMTGGQRMDLPRNLVTITWGDFEGTPYPIYNGIQSYGFQWQA